nr:redoxin family protein [uncultured bacterium]
MDDLTIMDRSLPYLPLTVALSLLIQPAAVADSVDKALSMKPVQDDVQYARVSGDDAKKCTLGNVKIKGWRGFELIGPDGATLRRFADTNDDKKIDLWSYFQYGVEVYRDVDADFDGKADQYRWLNTGGTRWGLDDNEDGQIDRWKQISAEEVSAEVVSAIRDQNPERFVALLITEKETAALGLGEQKTQQIDVKSDRAARDFGALAKRQSSIGSKANWVQFAAATPGVVPQGTDGSTEDVLVYENAVAMFEDGDKSGQLMVGTLIRVGEAWRLVELPSLGSEGEAITQSTGNFFTPGGSHSSDSVASAGIGEETQALVNKLEQVDSTLSSAEKDSEIAKLHEQRAEIVEQLIAASGNPQDRETWVRQLIDTLSIAAQTGAYPDGAKRLRQVAKKFTAEDKSLRSYADYQAIGTEYVVRQTPKADFAEVQEWYLDALNGFVDRYPDTPEAAQAWLQLALSKEFEDKEKDALKFYKKVASSFRSTPEGEKAAGAVRRLESVGKPIALEGTSLNNGKPFSLSAYRGKPIVLHYWATWCEPCKQDMKLLRQLQARYQRAGLQLVGVNVDQTRDQAVSYLKESKLPWTQLFEDGGLEASPLATAYGVQTLPTMMLIAPDGKVVRHNVRAAELDDELAKMLKKK